VVCVDLGVGHRGTAFEDAYHAFEALPRVFPVHALGVFVFPSSSLPCSTRAAREARGERREARGGSRTVLVEGEVGVDGRRVGGEGAVRALRQMGHRDAQGIALQEQHLIGGWWLVVGCLVMPCHATPRHAWIGRPHETRRDQDR
jgi:hypothetical protein